MGIKKYRDKHGPFDAYLLKGQLEETISAKYYVRRAFDMDGMHIGVARKNRHLLQRGAILMLLAGLTLVIYFLITYKVDSTYCIINREPIFYRNDEVITVNITNRSDSQLILLYLDKEYTLSKNETLHEIDYTGLDKIEITFIYNGHTKVEFFKIYKRG